MATPRRYWCENGLVVVVDTPQGQRVCQVDKPLARLGDGPDCEVALPAEEETEQGLYLHATETGVYAVGLGQSVRERGPLGRWLIPEETVTLGEYRISAQLTTEPRNGKPTPPDLGARSTIPAPRPCLVVSVDGEELAACRLSRRLTILGSHGASNVRIRSRSIAPVQLAFYWNAGVLWCIDLTGAGEARWRGRPFDAVRLVVGDSVVVGDVRIALEGSAAARSNGKRDRIGAAVDSDLEVSRTVLSVGVEPRPSSVANGDAQPTDPSSDTIPAEDDCETSIDRRDDHPEPTLSDEPDHEDPDALFDRVTDRMLELEHQAARQRGVVRIVLAMVSVLVALGGSLAAFHYAGPLLRSWFFRG
ncbi:MAG: hypothetical protein JW818_19520 [Pirellulales bacterium]|nr:hypothetical protein [Pirellulales bacterium]